jgi:C4-dicarboxylate transporter DctM subunit
MGWLPGGLAVATVGGCVFFAAISGSSPVTVIAIGTIMVPALVRARYRDTFAVGLVTTAGSLGILIPPSIPMIVYAIAAGSARPVDVGELFLAGVVPGLLVGSLLALWAVLVALREGLPRERATWADVAREGRRGLWALLLPAIILGGIYGGIFTPTEAAAVSVVYAFVVELGIHRRLGWRDVPRVLAESAVLMGTLLVVMAMAFALNHLLVERKVADTAVELIRELDLSVVAFLAVINVFLLFVGAVMDSISAILIVAPLLAPMAYALGIDPIHLGVVFIVNLEIGYLTPPIGLNLFVASAVFGRPVGWVVRAVAPFLLAMGVGLALVTYVPTLSMGAVNALLRDEPWYEPLPERVAPSVEVPIVDVGRVSPPSPQPGASAAPASPPAGRVLSVEEMMRIAEQGGGGSGAPEEPQPPPSTR